MHIVCGIIASHSAVYNAYKVHWVELIRRIKGDATGRFPTVDFYFLYNGAKDALRVEKHAHHTDLHFPYTENVIPGILQKTVAFYRWIGEQDIPYTHMIRTNLSSFYRFDRLAEPVARMKSTRSVLAHMIEGYYPSGCGALFTRDVIEEGIAATKLDLASTPKYDDQVLGDLVHQLGVAFHTYRFVELCNLTAEEAQARMAIDHFHYRTKFRNDNSGMLGTERFRILMDMYYPVAVVEVEKN